jgi:hypothetical protein
MSLSADNANVRRQDEEHGDRYAMAKKALDDEHTAKYAKAMKMLADEHAAMYAMAKKALADEHAAKYAMAKKALADEHATVCDQATAFDEIQSAARLKEVALFRILHQIVELKNIHPDIFQEIQLVKLASPSRFSGIMKRLSDIFKILYMYFLNFNQLAAVAIASGEGKFHKDL